MATRVNVLPPSPLGAIHARLPPYAGPFMRVRIAANRPSEVDQRQLVAGEMTVAPPGLDHGLAVIRDALSGMTDENRSIGGSTWCHRDTAP